ncbi:hypothetical protein RFI_06960 [Reticulomyxa filosa]|uniref:Uncharacterized protein n=1 Tax=Reticulomyxa filosa TaxID=46433 RepID=X6NVX0_RETFI|nr:hypothetical protein RFI_06960 [Reticulomyxa filosa]|eukprot:ETO30161.1 hypothetical protein RFI_06960 [Reticulomyxa filosa]
MSIVISLFEFAASANEPFAQASLGFIYLHGAPPQVSANVTKAIDYFTAAANQNSSEALWNLGMIFYEGYATKSSAQDQEALITIPKNFTKALVYFHRAALLGSWKAMYRFALMLWQQEGVQTADCRSAIKYMKFVAEFHPIKFNLEHARIAFEMQHFHKSFILYSAMAEQVLDNSI